MNIGGALLFLACLSVHCQSHFNLVIFNQIFSKFHVWIASIKLLFKFEYRLCLMNNKQNGRRLSVSAVVVTLTGVIFNQISSKFHICIASIKLSFKFKYGFCPTNTNKDG